MMCSRALSFLSIYVFTSAYAAPMVESSAILDSEEESASWLFTTYHNGGSITVKDGKTEFELDQVSKDVIVFSDRPQRLVKTIPSRQFEEAFNDPEVFGDDPPNAVTQIKVACDDGTVEIVDLVFEMKSVKSSSDDTVVYEIDVLESLDADGEPSVCIDFLADGTHELKNHSSGVFIDNFFDLIGSKLSPLTAPEGAADPKF